MKIELKPTEVTQIDIYQFDDPLRKKENAEIDNDYKLDLEVEYTLQSNWEYTFSKRFYGFTYRELFDGTFLKIMLENVIEGDPKDIDNIPIRLHLTDRLNPRKQ